MALVSVVIPALNREKYLPTAIGSVLAQTYSDFEVIVVDDGSADGTRQVAEEYARKDPRVRCLAHGQKKGAQAARNSGIHAARGQWIAFLDSDDQWLPDSLEVRLQLARTCKVQVVHSNGYYLKPDDADLGQLGLVRRQAPAADKAQVVHANGHYLRAHDAKAEQLALIFKGALGFPLLGPAYKALLRRPGPMFQALLVARGALARIGYLDESIRSFQEWDTAIRLARYYSFAFVPQPTFIWNCRNPDSMSRNLTGSALGYEQVIAKHQWAILRHLGPRALASHFEMAAAFYRVAGDEAQQDRCWKWANVWWPFRPSICLARLRRWLTLGIRRHSTP
jgi:glycosyltransferase involved in cell wall biosynthesis